MAREDLRALYRKTRMSRGDLSEAYRKAKFPMVASHGAPPPGVPREESAARGALQGLSAGFGDEASAAIAATLPFTDREAVSAGLSDLIKGEAGNDWADRYRRARDFYRRKNTEAEVTSPGTYLAGQVGGTVVPALVTGGGSVAAQGAGRLATAAPLLKAAGQGAAMGMGFSGADLTRGDVGGLARDTAVGAGLGLAGYGAGQALSKGAGKLAEVARRRYGAAVGEAERRASAKVDKAIASLRGAYGAARQNESRAIEVLLRAEGTGALTAEQAAQLAALKSSPEWAATIQNVATNYMEDFPVLAQGATSAKEAFQKASGSRAADVTKLAASELSAKEAKAQLLARLKRYGPVGVLGAMAGGSVGGPFGALLGGASGAAVRPMLHAVRRMATHPSVQAPVWTAIQRAAESPGSPAGRALIRMLRPVPALGAARPDEEKEEDR